MDMNVIVPIAKKIQAMLSHENTQLHETILHQFQGLSASERIKLALQVLTELSTNGKISAETFLKCLLKLDEGMQDSLEQLTAKRLKVKLYNRDVGLAIDAVVYPYYRRLFLEYSRVISLSQSTRLSLLEQAAIKALLYCRTYNAGFSMMMWRYFDDQPPPADAWMAIHDLFKYAENSSILYERVMLYPDVKKPVDMAVLMVNGLMLSTLQKENYNAVEIHIVSRLLNDWVRQVMFEKAYAPEKYQYFVNLNHDKGAERIRAFDRTADYRYWRTEAVVTKIADHLAAIGANAVGQDSDIRGYASMRTMTKLFKKLSQDWSVHDYKRQRRAVAREKTNSRLLVTSGLEQICKQLSKFQLQDTVQDKQPIFDIKATTLDQMQLTQTKHLLMGLDEWVLMDVSDTGFGVDLGREPSPWVEAGKLVGFAHPQQKACYVVAEIKHIKRQKNGAYRAGLQIISLHSLSMQLIKLDHTQVELSKGFYLEHDESDIEINRVACVWVPPHHTQPKSSVIIPINEYQRHRQFKIDINGEEKTLVLGVAIEMQTEWVRASVAAIH